MYDKIEVSKVGDLIYVDTSLYVTHGVDDFIGGLYEVDSVQIFGDAIMVSVKEEPAALYSWDYLSELQDKLSIEFGSQRGHKRPDHRQEFNKL